MAYSTEIRAAIEQYLKNDEWNYTFDEEREVIRCGINLRNRLKECRIIVDIDETKYLSLGLISLNCDEEHRVELSKFLTMVFCLVTLRWISMMAKFVIRLQQTARIAFHHRLL